MTDQVAAVVVTYNRVDKLERVLNSILAQSRPIDRLIVIDNASTDSTQELLSVYADDARVEVVRLDENTGGAGGFSAGMERAYERGADWVWIMDDDCYTDEKALEKLLAGHAEAEQELGRHVPYSCSLVRYTDGSICEMNNPGTTWDWGRLIAKGQKTVLITNCSFVSVLIPRRSIAIYGLPLKEYFIWFDDMEYTLRISAEGPGVQILDSIVIHDMPENRGVNYGDLNPGNAWKFYYGARNESSYRWHHDDKIAWLRFVATTYAWMFRSGVDRRLKIGVTKKILEGLKFDPKPKMARSVR